MRIGTSLIASWKPLWTLALLFSLVAFPAAAADPLAVHVFTDKSTYDRNQQALLTLQVTNTSSLSVLVNFSNGQQYDFSVRDASGTAVWTWSHGKTFSSTPSSKVLAPGETWQAQELWSFADDTGNPLLDGTFTVTGTYKGTYVGQSGPKTGSQDVVLQTSDPLVATFSTNKSSYQRLSQATLDLKITNVATYAVTIDFASAQSYDFSARDSNGQVVWTWSHGKTFDPTPQQVVLNPGDVLDFTAPWSFTNDSGLAVMDGNYTVSGTFLGQYYGEVPPKGGESQIRVYTLL